MASLLQETDLAELSQLHGTSVRDITTAAIWAMFNQFKDTAKFTVKIWFIRKTIHLRDLKPVFELLFGDAPA